MATMIGYVIRCKSGLHKGYYLAGYTSKGNPIFGDINDTTLDDERDNIKKECERLCEKHGNSFEICKVVRVTDILPEQDLEQELRALMRSPAYWRDHDESIEKKIREGFKKLYGNTTEQEN